jgi:hypothetical protein
LTGDQPEALQIAFGMLKYGQRAIEVHHLFVPALLVVGRPGPGVSSMRFHEPPILTIHP